MIYEESDAYITCALNECGITIVGKSYAALQITYRAHLQAEHNFMTGLEFWARWEKEFDKLSSSKEGKAMTERGRCISAAKRAAGVENEVNS